MGENNLNRLLVALSKAWPVSRGRNTEICKRTGYSASHVSGVLNNKVAMDDRFLRTVCREFSISELWVNTGEGEMFVAADPFPHGTEKYRTFVERTIPVSAEQEHNYAPDSDLAAKYLALDDVSRFILDKTLEETKGMGEAEQRQFFLDMLARAKKKSE
jgi:hypothetical protein